MKIDLSLYFSKLPKKFDSLTMKSQSFKILSFFLLILFYTLNTTAQNQLVDSLKLRVAQEERGEKVNALNELSKAYWSISADSSLKYAKLALETAQKINYDAGISDALNRIGNAYYFLEEDEKALSYYMNCLELRKKMDDYKRLIQIYNNLAVYYSYQRNFDKTKEFYNKALELSKNNNDKEEAANYNLSLADLFARQNKYDKAIEYFYNAEELYKELDDKVGLGNVYNQRGYVYREISSYDKALKAFLNALDYHKSTNNLRGMATSYNYIGIINETLKNYEKALEYYNKMIEIYEDLDLRSELAIAYNNIGVVYDKKEENKKALDYYEKAYEINKEFGFKSGMSSALNNIGLIYFELDEYTKALDYLRQSMNLSKEIMGQAALSNTYNNMAEVLIKQKKYNEAHKKIDDAIEIAKEIKAKEYIDESYRLYSILYEAQSDYKKALQYQKLHSNLNDTLFSREKQNRISEIQIKYETEKNEKEIELLKKDNEIHKLQIKRQKSIILFTFIGVAMLLIVAGLIYNQFNLKRKNEKKLRELNATKDKFFSIIAHDLKNPFQALFGFAEVMYKNVNEFSKEEIKEYSRSIYDSSQNLYNLLENLLQWSRSQLGSIKINPQKMYIKNAVDDIIILLAINADEKNIKIENNVAKNATIYADENVFSTVMRNLLNNSIKFTDEGGKIKVDSQHSNSSAVVSVSDTGKGIAKEDIQKLFKIDKSHSTKGTLNEPGTGLGLILCKELIEKSNGKIWVESEEGKGSTFKFYLPAQSK